MGKWLPVVTHNRKVDHLSFPLQEESIPRPSLASRSEDFQVSVDSVDKHMFKVESFCYEEQQHRVVWCSVNCDVCRVCI